MDVHPQLVVTFAMIVVALSHLIGFLTMASRSQGTDPSCTSKWSTYRLMCAYARLGSFWIGSPAIK